METLISVSVSMCVIYHVICGGRTIPLASLKCHRIFVARVHHVNNNTHVDDNNNLLVYLFSMLANSKKL